MLQPTVKRGLMLDFIGEKINPDIEINEKRVFAKNDSAFTGGVIYYIMNRDFRLNDNWGFYYAHKMAKQYKKKFKVIIYIDENLYSKVQYNFILHFLKPLRADLESNKIDFVLAERNVQKVLQNPGMVVYDFNPITNFYSKIKDLKCPVFEVDSHNVIPARFVSDKQEYSAANLRKKIYANIHEFLTEFPYGYKLQEKQADRILHRFLNNGLNIYAELRNDPNADAVSNLSKFFHFGIIAPQRVALEILRSDTDRANKEAYLEEMIVRRELSDNFCLYNKDFDNFKSIPDWAKDTLLAHKEDIRPYLYTKREFEMAQTHDELWNAAQNQLLREGKIHGYMRMYWAKKILEWAQSPEEALKIGIYLNDTYAVDGNSPNGYVGVLWSVGALHDRAFFDRPVSGKIRYMSYDGCKRKFDVGKYIKNYS